MAILVIRGSRETEIEAIKKLITLLITGKGESEDLVIEKVASKGFGKEAILNVITTMVSDGEIDRLDDTRGIRV